MRRPAGLRALRRLRSAGAGWGGAGGGGAGQGGAGGAGGVRLDPRSVPAEPAGQARQARGRPRAETGADTRSGRERAASGPRAGLERAAARARRAARRVAGGRLGPGPWAGGTGPAGLRRWPPRESGRAARGLGRLSPGPAPDPGRRGRAGRARGGGARVAAQSGEGARKSLPREVLVENLDKAARRGLSRLPGRAGPGGPPLNFDISGGLTPIGLIRRDCHDIFQDRWAHPAPIVRRMQA